MRGDDAMRLRRVLKRVLSRSAEVRAAFRVSVRERKRNGAMMARPLRPLTPREERTDRATHKHERATIQRCSGAVLFLSTPYNYSFLWACVT